jgi:hypothetical protein
MNSITLLLQAVFALLMLIQSNSVAIPPDQQQQVLQAATQAVQSIAQSFAGQVASGIPTTPAPTASSSPTTSVPNPTTVTPPSGAPTITSVNPTSAPIGSVVTVYGAGFAATDTVELTIAPFPDGYYYFFFGPVTSSDGKTVQFTITTTDENNLGTSHANLVPGRYALTVITSAGTSNVLPFTITK